MSDYPKITIQSDNRHVVEYGAAVMISAEMGRWIRKHTKIHCMFAEQLNNAADGYHYYCLNKAIHFFFTNPDTAMRFKLKFLGQ